MQPLSFLKGPHLRKALVPFAVLPRGCPVLLAAKSSPNLLPQGARPGVKPERSERWYRFSAAELGKEKNLF